MRVSSAFLTKARKISNYVTHGVIAPEDARIIAICGSRFGAYVTDRPLPLILSVLFPMGDAYVTIDPETGDVVNEGFQGVPFIHRQNGKIPRSAFIDERFAHVSGAIWSRIGPSELSRVVRPLTYVHNPMALVSMPKGRGV